MAFRRAQGTILPLPGRVVSTTANFEKVDNVCWCLLAASVLILFDCNAVQALETACIRAQLLHTVAQTEATVAVSGQLQYWTLHANAAEGTLPTSLIRSVEGVRVRKVGWTGLSFMGRCPPSNIVKH